MGQEFLDFNEAVKLLPDGDTIHTFLNHNGMMLIGADWDREEVLDAFKKYKVQKSGEQAMAMKHGLVFHDGERYVFVETREN